MLLLVPSGNVVLFKYFIYVLFWNQLIFFFIGDEGHIFHSSLLISDLKKTLKYMYFCDLFQLMTYLILLDKARLLYKYLSTMQT